MDKISNIRRIVKTSIFQMLINITIPNVAKTD